MNLPLGGDTFPPITIGNSLTNFKDFKRSMTVQEYRQKMELFMIREGIDEKEDITIVRFLSGLNLDIRDRLELLPYRDLNDLFHIGIKVEQQLMMKSFSKGDLVSFESYAKKEFKKDKDEPYNNLAKEHDKGKGESVYTPSKFEDKFFSRGRR